VTESAARWGSVAKLAASHAKRRRVMMTQELVREVATADSRPGIRPRSARPDIRPLLKAF
jgi:hypothetical protein